MSLPDIVYFGVATSEQNIVNFHCVFIYTNPTNIDIVCLTFPTFQSMCVCVHTQMLAALFLSTVTGAPA